MDIVSGIIASIISLLFIHPVKDWFKKKYISPLLVEVTYFSYMNMQNDPDSLLPVVTGYPRRYSAGLSVTNRSERNVYIEEITLSINGGKVHECANIGNIPILEPNEYRQLDMIFPLADDESPAISGKLQFEVSPTLGRKTRISKSFPLTRDS